MLETLVLMWEGVVCKLCTGEYLEAPKLERSFG